MPSLKKEYILILIKELSIQKVDMLKLSIFRKALESKPDFKSWWHSNCNDLQTETFYNNKVLLCNTGDNLPTHTAPCVGPAFAFVHRKSNFSVFMRTLMSNIKPFMCGKCNYIYVNRLDPGQPPSNTAAGLSSNLFATQSIIPHKTNLPITGLKFEVLIPTKSYHMLETYFKLRLQIFYKHCYGGIPLYNVDYHSGHIYMKNMLLWWPACSWIVLCRNK